ncbi:MAG: putative toxin-antitoxin system toxin component, PIN family [Saprospiraceae bacterium]|nr:putative toxin-antitoxin system toxin component, PIN family [Saprospiraceae bacterium]
MIRIVNELTRVLTEKFGIPADKVNRILDALNQVVAIIVEPNIPLPNICRDPDDNYILQLAESAKADLIVTGDKDLLTLAPIRNVQLISLAVFLQLH